MNKTLSRVLWIIAGVLLIVAGVYCFVSPEAALSGLSLILGLAMLFSGIVDIVIFAFSCSATRHSPCFRCRLFSGCGYCSAVSAVSLAPLIFSALVCGVGGGLPPLVSSLLLRASFRSMIPFPVLWPSVGSLDWCLSCRVSHLLHGPASPGASGETLFYKTTITSSIIFKNDRGFGSGLFAHLHTCMQLAFLL